MISIGYTRDEQELTMHQNIHIAAQTGAYMLIGISEIFASVTGYVSFA